MKSIIIVADQGHFKAYRMSIMTTASPRIELIRDIDFIQSHGRMSEKLTDESGRFGVMGGKDGAAHGYGERHGIPSEEARRQVNRIAEEIKITLGAEGVDKWHLAASKGINNQILECLDKDIKAALVTNIPSDFTNMTKEELIGHFTPQ